MLKVTAAEVRRRYPVPEKATPKARTAGGYCVAGAYLLCRGEAADAWGAFPPAVFRVARALAEDNPHLPAVAGQPFTHGGWQEYSLPQAYERSIIWANNQ